MNLQESKTGFYYVGTKRANITKLVSIYKRGYASSNLNHAMSELTKDNHIQPDVICCESGFGFSAIKTWAEQLSKHESLSKIPLIIDADQLTAAENSFFIRNR